MEVHGDFIRRGVIIICPSTSVPLIWHNCLSADERASVSTNIVIVGGPHAAAAAGAAACRLPL